VPHSTDERGLRVRLLRSLVGGLLALGFALAAAHSYAAPSLNGAARDSPWLERDSCFALLSALLAIGVGHHARVRGERSALPSAVLVRALTWLLLTILLAAAWRSSLSLLTLPIAPSHAFACLRLVGLGRAWRVEQLWRK